MRGIRWPKGIDGCREWRDDQRVVEAGVLLGERMWFYDTRTPDRRMAVSWHGNLVVISLWQGDRCTGTFRLPLADAADLISALAQGMVAEAQREPPGPRPAHHD